MKRQVLFSRDDSWRNFIERADELIASPQFRPIKREGRTVAGIVQFDGRPIAFLKRSEVKSRGRGIVERFRGSRAARAVRGAQMLESANIPHPAPLAAMNVLENGGITASYLVTELIADGDSLSRFTLGPAGELARDARRRKQILGQVAREVRRIHDAGLYTRDLQETNVMVQDATDGYRVYFIDLEDYRKLRRVSWEQRLENLVHLDRSIGRFLCRAARLDFFYSYLGERPSHGEARRMIAEYIEVLSRISSRHTSARSVSDAASEAPAPAPGSRL